MNGGDSITNDGPWYLGHQDCTVDGQRRIAVPSRWRRAGDERTRFFLLPGRQTAIQMIPGESFAELLSKLRRVSFADGKAARALAQIGSIAQECVCDKQGRITLTPELMTYAGLSDKALLLGAVTFVQIWQPEKWRSQQMETEDCLDIIQSIQEEPDELNQILRNAARN